MRRLFAELIDVEYFRTNDSGTHFSHIAPQIEAAVASVQEIDAALA